ncbi:MAG: lysine 2,3-aminomutase [Deltaproteobacteria bacterium]|nr:lysine 2,3-aminomutase [Deltaproteobacteria bacterium]
MRDFRSIPIWKNVTDEQWNDWKWQLKNAIRNVEDLKQVMNLSPDDEREIRGTLKTFDMSVTPYYMSLIDPDNKSDPVRAQSIPTILETHVHMGDLLDPLDEEADSPVHGLTHRYPDRVLMLITNVCSMYCRHCTRRRMVGEIDRHLNKDVIDAQIEYIKSHPAVRDVLVSGGDPLMYSTKKLEEIISRLRDIPSVEIIRIGTRMPVVLPQRITDDLVNMLKKYHPIYINTHFNHPNEITPDSKRACEKLADAGIPLGNQTVLLRNVNDCPHVIKKLMHELVKIRVKPYYLYQCDLSRGISHFRTTLGRGIEIIESLRGHTSGYAVPTFVVDAPGGGGKIPVGPQYLISRNDHLSILRNWEGVISVYHENTMPGSVCGHDEACNDPKYAIEKGVARIFTHPEEIIEPSQKPRKLS